MSKTIDERVVSMQFDNKHFEANVKDTMSTLDKLKAKLNFSGASKGLEEVNTAANKVNMSGLGSAVQSVHAKFSALEIAGITAMSRLTNAAITAGTNMVRALTITPITTGWSEYELKMNSIKTIMASTGEDLDTVNKYLNDLNEYSDKTIYSFSDMTQNIGKFTNAGVKLEDAVMAIQGIANVAAVSGANANEASRSMYNFAQALSAGYVKLIDWKSIELANMATVEFKEQLIESAVAAGTLTKTSDGLYKTLEGKVMNATTNFNDTLQDQWMTTEVLISTLRKYSDETTDIGKKASKSATQVNTFSKMMDALKESAQSGWARTWELIFGDFEEGTNLWTKVNDVIGGVLNTINDARNALVENTFAKNTKSWKEISKYIEDAGINIEDFKDRLLETGKKHSKAIKKMIKEEKSFDDILNSGNITKEMLTEVIQGYVDEADNATASTKDLTDKLEYFRKVVKEVWRGDYANVDTGRIEKLTAAGYDYYVVQDLVNKTIDDHTVNLEDLTDVQLEHLGYTEKEIEAIRQLGAEAKKSGSSLNELLDDLSKPSGRELLGEAFGNIGAYFKKIFGAVKTAWDSTFDSEFSLYGIIEAFKELTDSMVISEEQANRLTTILQGIFSAVDISWSVASASFMGFMKILDAALHLIFGADVGIGTALEYIAEKIIALNKWIEESTIFGSNTKWSDLAAIFVSIGNGIKSCVDAFLALKPVQNLIEDVKKIVIDLFGSIDGALGALSIENVTAKIGEFFTKVQTWLKSLENSEQFGFDLISGLVKGMADGMVMLVQKTLEVCEKLFATICNFFGIASPSKLMITIGKFIIAGLIIGLASMGSEKFVEVGQTIVNGIVDGIMTFVPKVWTLLMTMVDKIVDLVKGIDLGTLLATSIGVGILWIVSRIVKVAEKIVNPLGAMKEMFEAIGGAFKTFDSSVKKYFKAKIWETRSNILMTFAKAVLIISLSLALLSKIAAEDSSSLWTSVAVVAALAGVMIGLSVACKLLDTVGKFDFKKGGLAAISIVILALAASAKLLSTIDGDGMVSAVQGMILMIGSIVALLFAIGKLMNKKMLKSVDEAGWMMVKLSAAILIMSYVLKQLASIPAKDAFNGLLVIGAVEVLFLAVIAISKLAGEHGKSAGSLLLRMSAAIGIMLLVVKMAAKIDEPTLEKAMTVITKVGLLFIAAIAVSHLAGQHAGKAGLMLLGMSSAMLMMVFVVKQASSIPATDVNKALSVVTRVMLLFAVIIAVSKLAGQNAAKAGAMMTLIGGSMLMMVGAIAILSLLDPAGLARGTAAVSVLLTIFSGLIAATHKAQDCMKNLIVMTVAIAVLAAAVALLCLIPEKDLLASSAALGTLMFAFAAMIASTKLLNTNKKVIGKLITMLAVVGVLAAIVTALSWFTKDANQSVASAIAMGILLNAMSASMVILSNTKSRGLTKQKVEKLAMMGLVVAELAIILGLMDGLGVQASIKDAIALSILLNAMAAAMLIVSKVGLAGSAAITAGLTAFVEFAAVVGVIIGIIGAIGGVIGAVDQWSKGKVSSALDSGIVIFEKIGQLIGAFIGGIGKGAMTSISSGFEQVGKDLSDFMVALQPFITGAQLIDEKAMNGVKAIAGVILALTAADLVERLMSPIFGSSSLTKFATQLVPFGSALTAFSATISGKIDEAAVTSAANCGKLMSELAAMIPNSGGVLAFFVGDNRLEEFGSQLFWFGVGLTDFSSLLTLRGVNEAAITAAANCGKLMAELAAMIPNTGGVLAFYVGDNRLDKFGSQLMWFGVGLTDFSALLTTRGINETAITAAANCGKLMTELANMIPNSGGVLAFFTGDNRLDKFGSQLVSYANALTKFSKAVSGENALDKEAIQNACDAGMIMSKLSDVLPRTGGLISLLMGYDSLGFFGDQLADYGKGIAKLSKAVSGENAIDVAAIENTVKAGTALAGLQNSLEATGGIVSFFHGSTGLDAFGDNIVDFAKAIKKFASNMAEVDNKALSSSVSSVKEIISMTKELDGVNSEGLADFGKALSKVGEDGVDKFIEAFDNAHTKAATAVDDLIGEAKKAASDNTDTFKAAFATLVTTAANAMKSKKHRSAFYSAGEYLSEGFANGIESKASKSKVSNAATAVGGVAVSALNASIDAHSPSRESYKSGGYFGSGFVNAIIDYAGKVFSATAAMGESAKEGLTGVISRISEAISSDIDSQPTIRPVLDLSDVTAGAGTLNSLFNTNPSMGVLANVNAVGSMMNSRQNGANDDVVSAINGLKTALGDNTGNSYTINGITYDDGSNITDAVKSLVRAAKIERRV